MICVHYEHLLGDKSSGRVSDKNNAVSQAGANAKRKLYYLRIEPFVQGLIAVGLLYRQLKVLDQERTNDLVKDQEQEIPSTIIVINEIMNIIAKTL